MDLYPDEWQAWWLDHALSTRADGDWCASDTCLICGRQSGKNVGVLAPLELFALFDLGESKIIHSAHEVPTSLEHFELMVDLIDRNPKLSDRCLAPVRTNGREAIRLRNGGKLQFRARGKNSGRGLSAPRIVFDEAFKIDPASMGALIPTTRAMARRQFTYASSAPKADSAVLHSLIRRGQSTTETERVDRLFYAEWGNPPGTAIDDVDAWYQANPALGIRVTEEALHDEYRTLVSGGDEDLIAEYAREAVGIGEDPATSARPKIIDFDEWLATATAKRRPSGRIVLAYDVDLSGESASIDLAAGTAAVPYLECIRHQQGVGWLAAELVGLVSRQDPIAVGYNAAGPALEQLGAIQLAFRDAGLDPALLVPLGASEYRAACGGLLSHISEGTLTRPKVAQAPIDNAAAEATERPLAEGRVFHRRNARVPISPLVAGAVACHLLPTPEPVAAEPSIGWIDL